MPDCAGSGPRGRGGPPEGATRAPLSPILTMKNWHPLEFSATLIGGAAASPFGARWRVVCVVCLYYVTSSNFLFSCAVARLPLPLSTICSQGILARFTLLEILHQVVLRRCKTYAGGRHEDATRTLQHRRCMSMFGERSSGGRTGPWVGRWVRDCTVTIRLLYGYSSLNSCTRCIL